jgi:hypothetical protein
MDAPKPKKDDKKTLNLLGMILIIGGVFVLRRANSLERLYPQPTETPWGIIFAWCLIVAGGIALLAGLAKRDSGKGN